MATLGARWCTSMGNSFLGPTVRKLFNLYPNLIDPHVTFFGNPRREYAVRDESKFLVCRLQTMKSP